MTTNEAFNNLCISQIEKTSEIRKILTNYRKAGKKTLTFQFVANKLQKLEQIWLAFKETDKNIRDHEQIDENHQYFLEKCYEKSEDWYNSVKNTLTEKHNSFTEGKETSAFFIPSINDPQENPSEQESPEEILKLSNSVRFMLQEDRYENIQQISDSVDLDSLSRVSRTYLEQKITTINNHWEAFQRTHNEIISEPYLTDLEHNYFKNKIYMLTEKIYLDTIILLKDTLNNRFCNIAIESFTSTTTFSLAEARSLIPTFNGNPRELHKFISSCDDIYATAISENEKQSLLTLIRSKLTSEAYDIFRYNEISDWIKLRTLLKQSFEIKLPRTVLQTQLNNCRQKIGESAKDFLQRLHVILSKLNEATYAYTDDKCLIKSLLNDNEKQASQAIEDGLANTQLQTLAKVHVDKTFSSLKNHILDHASRIETNHFDPNRSKIKQHLNLRCYNCNKLGHSSLRCSQNNKFNQEKHSNALQKSNIPPDIPNPTTSLQWCRYCRKSGHSIAECRTRATNNARYNTNGNTSNGNFRNASTYAQVAQNKSRNTFPGRTRITEPGIAPSYANGNISTQNQTPDGKPDSTLPTFNQGNELRRGVSPGHSSQTEK